MSIQVLMLPLGKLITNCFIVADTPSRAAIVIDPADQADSILKVIAEHNLTVKEILATHGHFDHVLASKPLKDATGAPFRIHQADVLMLQNMQKIAATFGIAAAEPAQPDALLKDGDVIEVGSIRLEALFTPGHSPGHMSFIMHSAQVAFSGDCLFQGSIGRTDLPGADFKTLMNSIREKLVPLGAEFTICPGHGSVTTIEQELMSNPYLIQG